jgi:hypothetical protein
MKRLSRPRSSPYAPNGGADWRSEANRRIQPLRRADPVVEVRGHDGAPSKDARVFFLVTCPA